MIICSDADEAQWLAERKKRLTASDVAAWLGKSPWDDKDSILREKRDGIERVFGEPSVASMRHGKHSEAHNMEKASLMLGLPVVPYHYFIGNDQWPHLGATLDGLGLVDHRFPPDPDFAKRGTKQMDTYGQVLETIDELNEINGVVIVEMKSTDGHVYKKKGQPREWIDEPPERYVIQCQVQMHVGGFQVCLLCAQLGAGSMTAFTVYRDNRFKEVLDQINHDFGAEMAGVGF